jgi:MoaA/NifB/PqqE/SkfB family radical SAM enzyme
MEDLVKVEIVTGFTCNNNCLFCSVRRKTFDKTFDELKSDIEQAAKDDPKEINFTGGEPTIRKDILDLISYTREKNVKEIRVTTNGRLFSYDNFTKSMIDGGLTGAIFSIHGHNAKLHDYLTQVKGSFDQSTAGLKKLREFTDSIDVNIVINKKNYEHLPSLTEMLFDKFDIRAICFIFPTIDGNLLKNKFLIPNYKEIMPFLQKSLDITNEQKKTAWVLNIPNCFFVGYEKYASCGELKTRMIWPKMQVNLDEQRKKNNVKIDVCKPCKFNSSCTGIPEDYAKIKGTEFIKAIKQS